MASLKNTFFGSINGKIGNAVARNIHGKDFISHRPAKYKKTKSKLAKSVRTKFAVTVEFARHVNSIPELSNAWQIADLNGYASYHRIIKYNSKYIGDTCPTKDNIILPPADTLCNYKLDITENELNVRFTPDLFIHHENDFTTLSIFVILLFIEPIRKGKNNFILKNASLKDIKINEAGLNPLIIPLEKSISRLFTIYKNMVVYSALTFNPKIPNHISWLPMEAKSFDLNALALILNQ